MNNIGPGKTEMCQRCVEHLKHDVDHLLADWLEEHSDILNGHDYPKDLLKARRGQKNGRQEYATVYPEAKTGELHCMEGE